MKLNPDFQEFLELFVSHDVRFLIVGGYALAAHGHPRYTKDLDVWVWPEPSNAERIVAALEDFGFGGLGLTSLDFQDPDVVVQLGREPQRIDILTFEKCCGTTTCSRLSDQDVVDSILVSVELGPFLSWSTTDVGINVHVDGPADDLGEDQEWDDQQFDRHPDRCTYAAGQGTEYHDQWHHGRCAPRVNCSADFGSVLTRGRHPPHLVPPHGPQEVEPDPGQTIPFVSEGLKALSLR